MAQLGGAARRAAPGTPGAASPVLAVAAAAIAAATAAGCGGAAPAAAPTAGAPAAVAAASSVAPQGTPIAVGAVDLSGRWARVVRLTATTDTPMVGEITSVTRVVQLVDLQQSGERVAGTSTTCTMATDTGTSFASTVIPDAYVQALAVGDVRGAFVVQRCDTGPCTSVAFDRAYEAVGFDDDDVTLPVPASATDTRVRDTDGDGQPGATLRVTGMSGGDMYVAQRAWRTFTATDVGDTVVRGVVDWDVERVVFDATSRALRANRPLTPLLGAGRSDFEAVRLAGDATCEAAVAAAATLLAD